jgi:tight adherence protein B
MVLPIALTFLVALVVVLGVYWAFVLRPESAERERIRKRLKEVAAAQADVSRAGMGGSGMVRREQRVSSLPFLERGLRSLGSVTPRLQQTIALSGLSLSVGTLVLAMGCAALGAYVLVYFFLRWHFVALIAGIGATWIPYGYVKHKARKRMLVFEEQFPEAIDLISRALRAGHAFTTGLNMVAEEAPQPIAGEFRQLYEHQNFGMPLPQAMKLFAERMPLLDARFFVTAVLTQRESGGNLSEVLDNLASVIRERFRVKRQVRVITAHARMTGWVLAGLPPSLAIAFMVTSPNHLKTMTGDPLGVQMIVGALLLQLVGTVIIRKLVDIEY